jgi:hypothetical protein
VPATSLWLNSGVPATEVARGHGVAVLPKIYADCIGIRDAEPDPGDEDDDTKQAS